MVEMALIWKDHSLAMMCDLVERVANLTDEDQARVWALIAAWATTKASDTDKAALREKIRISTLSRRAAVRAKKNGKTPALATAGKAAYAALEPSDILNKHAWLFRDRWVEESADEIEDIDEIDLEKRGERIKQQRVNALREILAQRGLAGIVELSERGNASWVIGVLSDSAVLSDEALKEMLRLALVEILAGKKEAHPFKNLIAGVICALGEHKRNAILEGAAENLSERGLVQLLILAPFGRTSWKLVDTLNEEAQAKYWSGVAPDWIHNSDAENSEGVERLLNSGRPRAAFSCARLEPGKLDPQLLFRLLSEMAQGGEDQPGQYMLQDYDVERAFKSLNRSPMLTLDQKAGLEFAYIDVLARRWDDRRDRYGIPNLQRYVEVHPELFVQAVVWTYKRKDGAADPVEFQVPPERVSIMAERSYKLLEAIERVPGHDDLGELMADGLARWVATVRHSCAELGRAEIADVSIGDVLSCAPVGQDGVWPCEPVREVMEDIQSEAMMRGAHTGVFNSRGAHWRGEGGDQERELAEKYRKWGLALQMSHPFVASRLLMGLSKTYDHEASREDTEAGIRRRLR